MAQLTELINIGPTTAKKLEKIGIKTAAEFLNRDPYQVFEELLLKVDSTLCKSFLSGLVGAKQGVPWHTVSQQAVQEFEKKHPGYEWEH